jgi:hypothetical protein
MEWIGAAAYAFLGGCTVLIISSRTDKRIARLLPLAWAIQLAGVAANQYLVNYYYGRTDTWAFLEYGGLAWMDVVANPALLPDLLRLFNGSESLLSRGGTPGTWTMIAIAAFTTPLTGGSFLVVSVLFAMLGLLGRIAFYFAIEPYIPRSLRKMAFVASTMAPSVIYWNSGLIKESVVIAFGGFAALSISRMRTQPAFAIPAGIGLYIVMLIKPHFILTAAISFAAWLYWRRVTASGVLQVRPLRLAMALAIILLAFLAAGRLSPRLDPTNIIDETERLQEAGNRGGSGYSLGGGTGLSGQLRVAPLALFTGLYRPSLLDARNAQSLFNALETTFLLYASILAIRRLRRTGLRPLITYPFLSFFLVFVVLSATGVALATANLGSLSRYRSPIVPFFAVLLLMLVRAPIPATVRPRVQTARGRPQRVPPHGFNRRDTPAHAGSRVPDPQA